MTKIDLGHLRATYADSADMLDFFNDVEARLSDRRRVRRNTIAQAVAVLSLFAATVAMVASQHGHLGPVSSGTAGIVGGGTLLSVIYSAFVLRAYGDKRAQDMSRFYGAVTIAFTALSGLFCLLGI